MKKSHHFGPIVNMKIGQKSKKEALINMDCPWKILFLHPHQKHLKIPMKIMVESLTISFQCFVGTPHEEFHAIGVCDVNVLWT